MIEVLTIICIVIAVIAFLAALAFERVRSDAIIRDLLAQNADLCQRIQAPAIAVAEHTAQVVPQHAPPAVAWDDDAAFFESKEALAERLARTG